MDTSRGWVENPLKANPPQQALQIWRLFEGWLPADPPQRHGAPSMTFAVSRQALATTGTDTQTMTPQRPKHFLLIAVNESDTERFVTALLSDLPAGWRREKALEDSAIFTSNQRLFLSCTRDYLRRSALVALHRCSKDHLAADCFTHHHADIELGTIARNLLLAEMQEALGKSGLLFDISYSGEIDADIVRVFW
jgi:hypothetical protein